MSLTFTEKEINQLKDAICNSSAKRSYMFHKMDIKHFLLSYFEKKRKEDTQKSRVNNSIMITKNSNSISHSNKKGSKDGYKIVKVSKNYEFPSSIYKKDTPESAAKSALRGIIRKNKLDDKTTFTFSLMMGEKLYKYTAKNGKLEAH